MTQPNAGAPFTATAENTSVLIDLKQPENEQYRAPALALLHAKYPEFGPGQELEEDLELQLGEDGFAHAELNTQTGQVVGLTAGVTLPSQTAALTYVVHADDNVDATSAMVRQTQSALGTQGVKAIVVEQEADKTQLWDVMRGAGFTRVPVKDYIQPLDAESDAQITGLVPIVAFSGATAPQERSEIMKGHFAAMTDLYDADRQNPVNTTTLQRLNQNLDHAAANFGWNMTQGVGGVTPAPKA